MQPLGESRTCTKVLFLLRWGGLVGGLAPLKFDVAHVQWHLVLQGGDEGTAGPLASAQPDWTPEVCLGLALALRSRTCQARAWLGLLCCPRHCSKRHLRNLRTLLALGCFGDLGGPGLLHVRRSLPIRLAELSAPAGSVLVAHKYDWGRLATSRCECMESGRAVTPPWQRSCTRVASRTKSNVGFSRQQ